MAADALAMAFSLIGSICMGSYPVPVKSERVLRVQPHPIIFQCYKTFWVFASGWLFLLTNKGAGFQFSWWAVFSAFCWVPAGLGAIVATPLIGIGMTMILATGVNTLASFLVFWLIFGSKLVEHGPPGHEFYLAPWYLAAVVLGMVALVAVPRASCPATEARQWTAASTGDAGEAGAPHPEPPEQAKEAEGSPLAGPQAGGTECVGERLPARTASQVAHTSAATYVAGIAAALLTGFCGAVQFGVASKARSVEERAAGCEHDPHSCPPDLLEEFNNFGSWMTSFGVGSAIATVFFLGIFFAVERARNRPLPGLLLRDLWLPGSVAGILWTLGNFFQLAAIMRDGPAVMAPANQCFQLVTSGVWGLIYYREIRGILRVSLWMAAAAWTVTAAVLLSREKAS